VKAHKQKMVVSQRLPTFMDVAGEGGENVLHTDRQVAANDVKLLDECGANELSWMRLACPCAGHFLHLLRLRP
jgi:hypothetical protein